MKLKFRRELPFAALLPNLILVFLNPNSKGQDLTYPNHRFKQPDLLLWL
ncbi:hypothetical protein COLO4_12259 [Corchorus olitorius]|uniref:Uncharacterized protein n=1 Tax=Corchorus olitorius TaxID=93759 RepID=A0A1R3K1I3_9ROSI|nr:hypothetical protein COLO4_12259 [Corchorus olitorius]